MEHALGAICKFNMKRYGWTPWTQKHLMKRMFSYRGLGGSRGMFESDLAQTARREMRAMNHAPVAWRDYDAALHRLDNEHIYASLRVDAIIMACAASPWYKDSVDMNAHMSAKTTSWVEIEGCGRRRRWRIRARSSRPSISSFNASKVRACASEFSFCNTYHYDLHTIYIYHLPPRRRDVVVRDDESAFVDVLDEVVANASASHLANVSRDPTTTNACFARVNATFNRRRSAKNPTLKRGLFRTAEHTTTSASLP